LASRLSPTNAGLQLVENAATTAFALVATIHGSRSRLRDP
jgi:hypothetical protein